MAAGGGNKWTFNGSGTPPDGIYYASQEIEIEAPPGGPGTPANPWRATLVAGGTSETGEVHIQGSPTIVPFLQDMLIVAGEVEVEGQGGPATLTGTIFATAPHHDHPGALQGEVEIEGNVNLKGNIVSAGEIEVEESATVTYNSPARGRILGPLRVVSWSSVSQ